MISKTERAKLYTGLGLFLEEFRAYVVSFLKERASDEWIKDFEKTLTNKQLQNWQKNLRRQGKPEELIDFSHLNSFAEEYKDLLKRDFPGKNQSLPTWLLEIAAVRHKIAHHVGVEEDEAQKAWIHLRAIAKALGKNDLLEELWKVERAETREKPQNIQVEKVELIPQPFKADKTRVQIPKQRYIPHQSSSAETLDIVNCANPDFRQTVLSHNVYLCPAKDGAYKHKQCKYLGVYWEKRVGAIAEIEAVIDVHSESKAEVYFINGTQNTEDYIVRAKEKALQLRPNVLPTRVFLLENLHPTDFVKDSPGGMFGSKIYLNVESLEITGAGDLAEKLNGKTYSELGLKTTKAKCISCGREAIIDTSFCFSCSNK